MPDTALPTDAPPDAAPAPAAAPGFWGSLPGILTGLATVLTAATGLFVALRGGSPAIDGDGPGAASPPQAHSSAPAVREPTAPPRIVLPHVGAASALHPPLAVRAILQDPDGFSNLRAAPGTHSAILSRLPRGKAWSACANRTAGGWFAPPMGRRAGCTAPV